MSTRQSPFDVVNKSQCLHRRMGVSIYAFGACHIHALSAVSLNVVLTDPHLETPFISLEGRPLFFNVVAFIAALFTVTAAQNACLGTAVIQPASTPKPLTYCRRPYRVLSATMDLRCESNAPSLKTI
ncbi:hypothetical protein B0H19DRAFT_1071180 [Mycena capillaripes]|nr:hypothetical protein B0H19DRAFT_1071180 [Mycena capillaripes]